MKNIVASFFLLFAFVDDSFSYGVPMMRGSPVFDDIPNVSAEHVSKMTGGFFMSQDTLRVCPKETKVRLVGKDDKGVPLFKCVTYDDSIFALIRTVETESDGVSLQDYLNQITGKEGYYVKYAVPNRA